MDMEQILKQAQQFQQKMGEVQNELAQKEITASVGGGMVSVTVNGRQEVVSVSIDPEVINPEEKTMLQDLVVAAMNEALRKAQAEAQTEMSKLTGGLKIPGLF